MLRLPRKLAVLAAALASPVLALALALPAGAAAAAPKPLLPNLFQSIPRQLEVDTDTSGLFPSYLLGFSSAVHNDGAGPLILRSHRPDTSNPDMTADQVVSVSDGTEVVYRGVGTVRYTESPTHQHWHFQRFETYELRRAADNKLIGTDRKTGFCLQDSFNPGDETLPGEPPQPVNRDGCGFNSPQLLEVEEGISVGWTDIYEPIKEGQSVDLTDVPAGRYYLVHRTNVDRHIRERSYSDDAASLLIDVEWPDGTSSKPTVTTVRQCYESRTCPASKARLSPAAARAAARRALARAVGSVPHHLALTCPRKAAVSVRCRVAWRDRSHIYAGRLTVYSTFASGGGPATGYSLRVVATARGCRPARCAHRTIARRGQLRPA